MSLNFANNNSLSAITTKPSGLSGGTMNLISTQTASSSSTISFTSGIDSTYDEYVFKFYDIHAQTGSASFSFQANASGGSGFNETITSTFFEAKHNENDSEAVLRYKSDDDQAQGTAYQKISLSFGTDNDASCSGTLQLFNPSSTTFVKHFISTVQNYRDSDQSQISYVAGYINTTSAIDEISFKFSSGNIDSGVIKLYGVS